MLIAQQIKSANTLLKCARQFGGSCTFLARASLKDVSRMVGMGKEVLVECGSDFYFIDAINDGSIAVRDLAMGNVTQLSVAQFARMWYIERGEVRFGRMIVLDQPRMK